MSTLPPAGWYDDPEVSGQLRYWDGGAWTDHRSPGDGRGTAGVGSGRLSDVGTWLERVFRDIWARRLPLLILAAVLLVSWAVVTATAGWAFGDLVWFDGDWSGVHEGRIAVFSMISFVAVVLSLVVYLAMVHQMYRYRVGDDPSVEQSLLQGLLSTPRLIGWLIVAALVLIATMLVVGILIAAVPPLGVLAALAFVPVMVWAWVRFSFFVVAVMAPVPGRNPFAASAMVSTGRFWSVFGRLVLVGLIGAVAYSVLSAPFAGVRPTPDFDGVIEVDDDDDLVLFHVGDTLDELGFTGGAAVVGSTIPQLLTSVFGITAVVALYADIHGRP